MQRVIDPSLLRYVFRCAGVPALFAFLVGYFIVPWAGWLVFCAVLLWQLLVHLSNLSRLDRWLRAPHVDDSLTGSGSWGGIFSQIYRHEKELHAQIHRHRHELKMFVAAAQALTDGIVLLDQNNRIIFCNAFAEAQFGLSTQRDRGQAITDFIRQPEFVAYMQVADFAQPLTLFSGRERNATFSISIIAYASDRRLVQIRDVTQAERLERMRRDFVANVSHELRTPLTVLAGFLETFREHELGQEEQARYLQMMTDQTGRMQSVIEDLLILSSIESAPPPENNPLDMVMLIDKLYHDAQALSAGRHVIEVESDKQYDLIGSESELISAFTNLINNAIRYTPAGGKIIIRWQKTAQGADFSVEDSGIGIDPQHIPRLTERFYRVDKGRSRAVGGTGLGLAIVKHALTRHQAQLQIKSILNTGSRFSAVFPAHRVLPRSDRLS